MHAEHASNHLYSCSNLNNQCFVQELGSLQGLARLASRALDLMDLTGPLLRAAVAQVGAQPALLAILCKPTAVFCRLCREMGEHREL